MVHSRKFVVEKMISSEDSDVEYVDLSSSGSDETNISIFDEESSNEDLNLLEDWYRISVDHPDESPKRFPFIGEPSCTFHLSNNDSPLEYFSLFVDDYLMDLLVNETNRYAQQAPGSSSDSWMFVDRKEMMIFLIINILIGLLKGPEEKMYWTTNEIFSMPIFPKWMSQKRYVMIKKIYISLIMIILTQKLILVQH